MVNDFEGPPHHICRLCVFVLYTPAAAFPDRTYSPPVENT